MTLTQIKSQLNTAGFNFGRCKDETGAPTKFLRHWDAKNRYALVIHEELLAHCKANPNDNKLALKWKEAATKERLDDKGQVTNEDTAGLVYDSYILIRSENIEDSL